MINLLTSASQFLSDTENFNSTTDKLLSSLFDGFIFYLAVVVFIITVLIITAKYRKNPTLGKRKSLTAITVLLTVCLLYTSHTAFYVASVIGYGRNCTDFSAAVYPQLKSVGFVFHKRTHNTSRSCKSSCRR